MFAVDRCACIAQVHFPNIVTKPYQRFRKEKTGFEGEVKVKALKV